MSIVPSREEALFSAALAQPAADRAAFLAKSCGADFELLARLFALVAAHERKDSLAGVGPIAAARHELSAAGLAKAEEKPGDVIGHYKLLQKLGEGGCGVVWMAEQEEPVRRRVALKIIKLGMDTKAVVARFEAERQALAMMDHPNIAKVHDAGATETGRPFFVMELVRGIPITKYCDENHLTPTSRLELFIKVCQAVQHAHQKGIIHRDLKPSNILVTVNDGAPTPKIIDFGIAKATQGKLTDATVFTAFEQFIGTPVYMSPEQAEMSSLDIDTRSDIYSLGVLLYELLTGRPPFDPKAFAQAGVDQIRQQIREVEPAKPSRRLGTLDDQERTTIARLRNTAPAQLSLILRGDLDWIIMRCLEKDRTRRYDTANGLAMDIQRHLRHEPVVARPPSTGYLLQKLIRRNRIAFAGIAAVVGALTAGGVVSTWQAFRAIHAEREQSKLRAAAEQAQAREEKLRHAAEAQEFAARRRAYAADMNLAQLAVANDNLGRAQELLDRQRAQPGQRDLRGWEWRYLWRLSQSDARAELTRRPNPIFSLANSANGRYLAVAEHEAGGLTVWDLRLQQEISVPAGDGRVAISPHGDLLAISTATRLGPSELRHTVRVWDMASRQVRSELLVGGRCCGLVFSADAGRLVTAAGAPANEIALWRISNGDKLASVPARLDTNPYGTFFAATQDLGLVAYGGLQGQLGVLDLTARQERWQKKGAEERIRALAFSPDGRILASGAGFEESAIRLWDVATGAEIRRLNGHQAYVPAIVFWPDGSKLASASGDQTIKVWDVASGRILKTLRGHKREVWRLALLPDNVLVSGGEDGAVYFWDATESDTFKTGVTLPDSVATWRFAADSKSILTVDPDGRVVAWTGTGFRDRGPVLSMNRTGSSGPLVSGQFSEALISSDLRLVAAKLRDGVIHVWDLQRRALVRELNVPGVTTPVAFLREQTRLIVKGAGDRYHECDLVTGTGVAAWSGPEASAAYSATLSRNEARCLIIGVGGKAIVRDMNTGLSTNFELSIRRVQDPQFSPDGRLFAAASNSGLTKIWDASSYRELATLSGFRLGVHSVGFSPDGTRLATGSNSVEAVRLWDVASHQQLLTLEGKGSLFSRTEFSPDGNVLSSQNGAGTLHLWFAPSWEEIEAKEKHAASHPARP